MSLHWHWHEGAPDARWGARGGAVLRDAEGSRTDYSLEQRVWASSLGHEEMSPVSEQVGTEQVCPSLENQERIWVRAAGLDHD